MQEYDQILKVTSDDKIELASSFKELLHTQLVLGQTRYMCRYGTLSDGHEKITPAQRYFAAIREMFYIGKAINSQRVRAMEAQADLLDAQEEIVKFCKPSDKLRAEAKVLQAQEKLKDALIQAEDSLRMLDEYNLVRLELKPLIDAQYPLGIEQAEEDNWVAVAKYRSIKEQVPGFQREHMFNIPLRPEAKAQLGIEMGRVDMIAPLMVSHEEEIKKLPSQSVNELLGLPTNQVTEPTKEVAQCQ